MNTKRSSVKKKINRQTFISNQGSARLARLVGKAGRVRQVEGKSKAEPGEAEGRGPKF
jgi:hypothetical protein